MHGSDAAEHAGQLIAADVCQPLVQSVLHQPVQTQQTGGAGGGESATRSERAAPADPDPADWGRRGGGEADTRSERAAPAGPESRSQSLLKTTAVNRYSTTESNSPTLHTKPLQ